MQQRHFQSKKNMPRSNIPPTRLGQVTVGKNIDNRIETRVINGVTMLYIMELVYQDTGPIKRPPNYRCVWEGTEEGFLKLLNLANAIYDDIDDHSGANLPIEQSVYDERYKSKGVEDGQHT